MSLVPSSTETLLALGGDVVACTRFCEQPHLAHVGGTKNPDVAAIVRLAPDLVVMDREENRSEDAAALVDAGLDLFVSDVRTVADAARVVVDLAALSEGSEDAPIVKLVNLIIYQGIKAKASDIHVEPFEKRTVVRYRVDGNMEEAMSPPRKLQASIASPRPSRRRGLLVLPIVVGTSVLLAGCSSDYWPDLAAGATETPTPSATSTAEPAADVATPVVTTQQAEAIVASVSAWFSATSTC